MPKMTLLEMTQDILSDMSSDAVNSIDDTEEALQVARVIRTTLYEVLDPLDSWPHLYQLGTLTGSGDSDIPTHMTIPDALQDVSWVKYNKAKVTDTKSKFEDVKYKAPVDFVSYINQRDSSDTTTVKSVTDPASGVILLIKNNVAPTYWTSFTDEVVVFDSYDAAVDSTLQSSKTQIYGPRVVEMALTDSATPDLPANSFSYLLAEAKSTCFNTIKQSANQKEEQKSRRQRYKLSDAKFKTNGSDNFIRFGRRR